MASNLLSAFSFRVVQGCVKEHFKDSFDGVFEHLANGGAGGKVRLMCTKRLIFWIFIGVTSVSLILTVRFFFLHISGRV